jgi:hypothetical protein
MPGSTEDTVVDTAEDAKRFPRRQQGDGYRTEMAKCY